MRKQILISLALILLTLPLFGCFKTTQRGGQTLQVSHERLRPIKGGSANIAAAEPVSIDAIDLEEPNGLLIGANIFDSLTDTDPRTMELIPAAAQSWEANKDMTVWTFHLKKGALFHNGRPVTAQDFKYSWERIAKRDAPTTVAYHLESVLGFDEIQAGDVQEFIGVKALDSLTLEIHLKQAGADFAYIVSNPTLAPVPKEEVEKDPIAFADKPIGNGPFMMAAPWIHNSSISLKRFEQYKGTQPYVDSVTFKLYPDEQSAYSSFNNKEVDFAIVPAEKAKEAKSLLGEGKYEARDGQRYLSGSELSIYFFAFNSSQQLYADHPQIMKAISLAIDRDKMVKELFADTRTVATSLVPPGVPGYIKDAGQYAAFDIPRAKSILSAAGFENGKDEDGDPLTVTISINTESGHEKVAQMIQEDIKKIGIQGIISNRSWDEFLEDTARGKVGFFRLGWMADYPIQDAFLSPLFDSKNIPNGDNGWTGDNRSRYRNKEIDKLLSEARAIRDDRARHAAYDQVEKLILDDAVCVPLFVLRHRHAVSDRVYGLVYDPLNRIDLTRVWISEKK